MRLKKEDQPLEIERFKDALTETHNQIQEIRKGVAKKSLAERSRYF